MLFICFATLCLPLEKKKRNKNFQHATNAYVSVRLNLILYLNSQGSRSVILSITGMQVVQGIKL